MFITDEYKPTLQFATVAMRMFAEAGASDISQRRKKPLAGSITETLASAISDKTSSNAINYEFGETRLRQGKTGYWPLPEISGNEDLFAFFRPRIDGAEDKTSLTIHLLLTNSSGNASVGMRFERGLQNDCDRHYYSHAQFLPELDTPSTGKIPLIDSCFRSCPAIPVPAIGPFGTWFSVLVSVAGHERGNKNGITRAFDDASRYFSGQDFGIVETALGRVVDRMLI